MAFGFPTAVRTALAQALIDYAGSGAILRIYSGSKPAVGGAEGTNLAQLTWTGNIGTATNGAVTITAPQTQTSATGAGATASWARIYKSNATTIVTDMVVTATGGGGDLTLDSTTISTGGTVAVTGGTITVGNG